MIDHYDAWVKQLHYALKDWGKYSVKGEFRSLIVCGLGGSGVVGDYLEALSTVKGGLPVLTYKHHVPPTFISQRDLVVAVSYSGNTHETLLFVEKIKNKCGSLVVVSSGGHLERFAHENGVPYVKVPEGYVPRTALPYMLYAILGLLDSSSYTIVSREEAYKTYLFIGEMMGEVKRIAEEASRFLYENDGLTILATHSPFEPLAVRGKNELNENSKIPVKIEVAPEWMHNDIVGWEGVSQGGFKILALRDPEDSLGSSLVGYMLKIYRKHGLPIHVVDLKGFSLLDKLIYGSLLLGYASVMLAEETGVNPLKTESIVEYKEFAKTIFKL